MFGWLLKSCVFFLAKRFMGGDATQIVFGEKKVLVEVKMMPPVRLFREKKV